MKGEVLDGMKMQVRAEGYEEHEILREEWDGSGVEDVEVVKQNVVSQPGRHMQLERGF